MLHRSHEGISGSIFNRRTQTIHFIQVDPPWKFEKQKENNYPTTWIISRNITAKKLSHAAYKPFSFLKNNFAHFKQSST